MRLFIVILMFMNLVQAEELGQGRLYLGSTTTSPSDLNAQLTTQGLKNVELVNSYGVEITFPTFGTLQTGLRYVKHIVSLDESPPNSATDYKVDMDQDVLLGVLRKPLVKNDNFYLDVFGGVGASKATYKIKSATVDGGFDQGAALNYVAGASTSVGFKKFYLVLEGGYEGNSLDNLNRTGNINGTVTSINMSGPYFLIGLMFDGIPIIKK